MHFPPTLSRLSVLREVGSDALGQDYFAKPPHSSTCSKTMGCCLVEFHAEILVQAHALRHRHAHVLSHTPHIEGEIASAAADSNPGQLDSADFSLPNLDHARRPRVHS